MDSSGQPFVLEGGGRENGVPWIGNRGGPKRDLDSLLSTTCSVPTDIPAMATMEASPPTGHDDESASSWACTTNDERRQKLPNSKSPRSTATDGDEVSVLANILVTR